MPFASMLESQAAVALPIHPKNAKQIGQYAGKPLLSFWSIVVGFVPDLIESTRLSVPR